MANTLGNLSLSDMKWLGNETDPIAPLMSGQTWALRKQQAQQSADMHPLKMQEMKSSTSYRDQQTSLSAQRERFNSLTETSRVNTADALSRSADAAARVSTGSVAADISLNKSNASLAEVRKNIAEATETTAKLAADARNMSAVTNQRINQKSWRDQVSLVKSKALLSEDASIVSGATLENQIESSNLALQRDKNNIEGQNLVLQQARRTEANTTSGIPRVAQYKEMMDTAYEQKQYSTIDDMAFSGVTGKQSEELDKYRAGIRRTELMKDHARTVEDVNNMQIKENTATLAAIFDGKGKLSSLQRGVFDALDSAGKPKYKVAGTGSLEDRPLSEDGKALAERFSKWNEMTEGMSHTAKHKLTTHITPTGISGPSRTSLMAGVLPSAATPNPYGETVKGVFIPSDVGLEAAEAAIKSAKAAKYEKGIRTMGELGLGFETGEVDAEGKVKLTAKRQASTASENQKGILDQRALLVESNAERETPLTSAQLDHEARRMWYAAGMPSASSASELRRQGITRGVPYWNNVVVNADGSVGGVRAAGVEATNETHDVQGRPAGGGAAAPAAPVTPAAPATPAAPPSLESKYGYDRVNPRTKKGSLSSFIKDKIETVKERLDSNLKALSAESSKINTGRTRTGGLQGRSKRAAEANVKRLNTERDKLKAELEEMTTDWKSINPIKGRGQKLMSDKPKTLVAPAKTNPWPHTLTSEERKAIRDRQRKKEQDWENR